MRFVNVLLSIVVSLALAFFVFEGGLRLVPAFRPQKTVNEFHPDLGWAKKPGADVGRSTSEFDISFKINSQGLRDDDVSTPAKQDNTFRVLTLGDSFVLGYTVDRQDLFVDLMEHWWGAEQRRVDVVNAGTEGYSTDQQVLWYQKYGKDYQPDLVLLFPYENDIYWNGQARYTRYPKPQYDADGTLATGTLTDPGRGSALSRWAVGNFLTKFVLPMVGGAGKKGDQYFTPEGTDASVFKEFAPLFKQQPAFLADALDRTRGALKALRDECRQNGARLVMIPIPSESAIHPEERERFQNGQLAGVPSDLWSPDRPVDTFLAMARELGIEARDPRSALRAAAESGSKLYFEQEWHFNPEGNRAFAAFVRDELAAMDVFPAEHAAIAQGNFDTRTEEAGVPGWMVLFAILWLVLGTTYARMYKEEPAALGFVKVGTLLASIFLIIMGGGKLVGMMPPSLGPLVVAAFVLLLLGFIAYKMGRRIGTILELLKAFTLRGHWYLMPLVVVLLTIGSLLVVAASSPLIAPFIYTLF